MKGLANVELHTGVERVVRVIDADRAAWLGSPKRHRAALAALCRAKLVEKPDGSAPHGNGESGGTRRSAGRDGRGRRQKRQEPSYREEGFGRLQEARPGQQATPDENIVSKAITDRNRT